jgi:hypothetical protein
MLLIIKLGALGGMSIITDNIDVSNLPGMVTKYILPWFQVAGEAIKVIRQVISGSATEGTYEVLDYDIKLELKDPEGKKAFVRKRERVKYLQNNIIAFQDQAWGDGKILQNYKCSPGVPVDKYRSGYKTHILISLREVKNQGDIDEFNIQWGISRGFLSPTGFWATDVDHKTDIVRVQVVFPKSRSPVKASVLEKDLQHVSLIGKDYITHLPDGRWLLAWEQEKPRRYEQYILRWEW